MSDLLVDNKKEKGKKMKTRLSYVGEARLLTMVCEERGIVV